MSSDPTAEPEQTRGRVGGVFWTQGRFQTEVLPWAGAGLVDELKEGLCGWTERPGE